MRHLRKLTITNLTIWGGENLQNSNQLNEGLCWRSSQKLKRQNEPFEEIHSNKSDKSMRGSSRNLQKQNRLLWGIRGNFAEMKNTLPTNKSWRRRGKVQKTGQLKVRPERLGHNGLASCGKSGGQLGRGTTCCLPTCVRSLSTTLQSAKNTKLNYRDRDWAIGPLVANGLWNEISMLAQYYSPSPWYSRDAENVLFGTFCI